MKKTFLAVIFLSWLAVILTIFLNFQKPDFLNFLTELKNLTLIILIPLIMTTLAACIGSYFLSKADPTEQLILGTGIGLFFFGLAGFGLAYIGWARASVFLIILVYLSGYFGFSGKLKLTLENARHVASEIKVSLSGIPSWIPTVLSIAILLAFILCLAPPAKDFDALFYHLTVPQWWMRDGGLTLTAFPHYWFPQIVEGIFVWPMALGFDTATHLIHLIWLILTIALVWFWIHQLWENSIAWNAVLILLTMPSLLVLATWAYTDYALTFTGLATFYSLWKWQQNTQKNSWLFVGGTMAGMAVSVKYTGFVVPLVGALLVLCWEKGFLQRFYQAGYFCVMTVLVAAPWYIRSWIWMGNPIYPFIFNGRYWDSFLSQAFSASGTGIGLDISELLMLPLTATLSINRNFFDGRIGPFFLILSPMALWAFWNVRRQPNRQRSALQAIGLFSLVSIAAWTLGVINSASLFQTRLLFPALIPLAIPIAFGMNILHRLDTPHLKISVIVRSMIALLIFVNLFNFSLQIIERNPIAAAIGITSRQEYMEKQEPSYAHLLTLMNNVPSNAKVYFLFEPRSYGINIKVQPDAIIVNFSHDLWLYRTPENIVAAWKQQGYTHVLLSRFEANSILQDKINSLPAEATTLRVCSKIT